MSVLILHGVLGHAGKHWMGWLSENLTKLHFNVIMPTLPNSNKPQVDEWREVILSLIKDENLKDLIIVGHSLGVPASLEIIQNFEIPIKALISCAGFYEDYGSVVNTEYMQNCHINIKKAKEKIEKAFVLKSDNDPYVPQKILNNLASGLEVEPIVLKHGGHFNTEAGYTTFSEVLEIVKTI